MSLVSNSLSGNFGKRLKSASKALRGNIGSFNNSSCKNPAVEFTFSVILPTIQKLAIKTSKFESKIELDCMVYCQATF